MHHLFLTRRGPGFPKAFVGAYGGFEHMPTPRMFKVVHPHLTIRQLYETHVHLLASEAGQGLLMTTLWSQILNHFWALEGPQCLFKSRAGLSRAPVLTRRYALRKHSMTGERYVLVIRARVRHSHHALLRVSQFWRMTLLATRVLAVRKFVWAGFGAELAPVAVFGKGIVRVCVCREIMYATLGCDVAWTTDRKCLTNA